MSFPSHTSFKKTDGVCVRRDAGDGDGDANALRLYGRRPRPEKQNGLNGKKRLKKKRRLGVFDQRLGAASMK